MYRITDQRTVFVISTEGRDLTPLDMAWSHKDEICPFGRNDVVSWSRFNSILSEVDTQINRYRDEPITGDANQAFTGGHGRPYPTESSRRMGTDIDAPSLSFEF